MYIICVSQYKDSIIRGALDSQQFNVSQEKGTVYSIKYPTTQKCGMTQKIQSVWSRPTFHPWYPPDMGSNNIFYISYTLTVCLRLPGVPDRRCLRNQDYSIDLNDSIAPGMISRTQYKYFKDFKYYLNLGLISTRHLPPFEQFSPVKYNQSSESMLLMSRMCRWCIWKPEGKPVWC